MRAPRVTRRRRFGKLWLVALAVVLLVLVLSGLGSGDARGRVPKHVARNAAIAAFVLCAGGLIFAERTLARRRAEEEAEAALREAFEDLERKA